jgi:hypothetical protein
VNPKDIFLNNNNNNNNNKSINQARGNTKLSSVLSIENYITKSVSCEEAIKEYAAKKVGKKVL